MIRVIDKNDYGKVHFSIDEVADIANLPKIGFVTGSTAEGIIGGKLTVYYFTMGKDKDTDGTWTKIA